MSEEKSEVTEKDMEYLEKKIKDLNKKMVDLSNLQSQLDEELSAIVRLKGKLSGTHHQCVSCNKIEHTKSESWFQETGLCIYCYGRHMEKAFIERYPQIFVDDLYYSHRKENYVVYEVSRIKLEALSAFEPNGNDVVIFKGQFDGEDREYIRIYEGKEEDIKREMARW